MKVSLKKIAEQANVSVASVSLALNNKPGVSESTRNNILKIAKILEEESREFSVYKQVREGSIKFLKITKHGHTLNRDHDVFISDYVQGIENAASKAGYNIEISSIDKNLSRKVLNLIDNFDSNGLIILGTELSRKDVELLNQIKKPKVFIDTFFDFVPASFVDMSNFDEVYLAVKHFVDMGHQTIGYIRTDTQTQNFKLRDTGFQKAMESFNLSCSNECIFTVDSTFTGAYNDMTAYLKRDAVVPGALFVANDIIALGCIKAFKEFGYKIPEDISLIGFDDLPTSSMIEPPLTTINVRKKRIGEIGTQLLIEKFNTNDKLPPSKTVITGDLIIRESVKKVVS